MRKWRGGWERGQPRPAPLGGSLTLRARQPHGGTSSCSLYPCVSTDPVGTVGPSWSPAPAQRARSLGPHQAVASGVPRLCSVRIQPLRAPPAPPLGFVRRGRRCPCQDRVGRPESFALQKNEFRWLPKDPLRLLVSHRNEKWFVSICTHAAGPEHGRSARAGRRSGRDIHTRPRARSLVTRAHGPGRRSHAPTGLVTGLLGAQGQLKLEGRLPPPCKRSSQGQARGPWPQSGRGEPRCDEGPAVPNFPEGPALPRSLPGVWRRRGRRRHPDRNRPCSRGSPEGGLLRWLRTCHWS